MKYHLIPEDKLDQRFCGPYTIDVIQVLYPAKELDVEKINNLLLLSRAENGRDIYSISIDIKQAFEKGELWK